MALPFWQRRVVNPLTAILFAVCTGIALHRFAVVAIPAAPYVSAAVVLISYLMLSKKYDPILSVIFFSLSLFLSYKTVTYHPQSLASTDTERSVRERLAVVAAWISTEKLKTGEYPQNLSANDADLLSEPLADLKYCIAAACPQPLPSADAQFWLSTTTRFSNDKAQEIWYFNDRFEVFRQTADGNFTVQPH